MSADPVSKKASRPSSHLGMNAVKKLVRDKMNVGVRESITDRPGNPGLLDRPDLGHARCDFGRQFPPPNDMSGDGRTHDVNDEMLAEEYRRGLRVRFGQKIVRDDLAFLFD